jgi:hypothetical protein
MKGIKQFCWSLSILSLLAPGLVLAQEKTEQENTATLERIEKKIDGIAAQSEESKRINIVQPLGTRTQGFEFNFFRLLTLSSEEKSLSGTYSFFNTENNTEIAIPFMFNSAEHSSFYGYDLVDNNKNLTSFTIDAHYRKYLGHRLDGFYLSAFARAAYLNGVKGGSESYYYSSEPNSFAQPQTGSEVKFGIGFGIGYRIISDSGYYWGTSLSVGRYLVGDSDVFTEADGISANLDDEEFIIDIELLKFGFAF